MYEFELNFKENEYAPWMTLFASILVAAIIFMAALGRGFTAMDSAGQPQVLSWSDWRMLQAQRAYDAQLTILRHDALQVAALLDQQRPNPVVAQMLAETITRDTQGGDPSLANARAALSSAALSVRDWSSGVLDRNTAIQAVQTAFALLQ